MSNKIITNAITAVLALGLCGSATEVLAATNSDTMNMDVAVKGMEKCYGVAKAHQNDCGNNAHTCSGYAKVDGDKKEWIFVPTGLCKRIIGGSTKSA